MEVPFTIALATTQSRLYPLNRWRLWSKWSVQNTKSKLREKLIALT